MATRPLVLFDADCGFCTRTARLLPGPFFRADVDLQSVQSADLASHGIALDDALALMHAVRPDGSLAIGHQSWAEVLRHCRQPWPLVGRLLGSAIVSPVAARVYAWIAGHRDRLPGGTPSCSVADRPVSTASTTQPVAPTP